jgi:membrane associated rhomboid family serine protease
VIDQPTPTPVSATSARDTIAGLLAALAVFSGLIGIVWHPLRLVSAAIILSMIAAGMTPKSAFVRVAVFVSIGSFFFGLLVAVVTGRPLW